MGYNTDPNNKETNRKLAKMGKDIDIANKGCLLAIFALAISFIILLNFIN